jgi:putative FmdB family regulatory protein|tara:strand:+ start:896 stop:1363 length:468 start_codon:yes stop_codon:yes gene_type:complete
MPIYDFRCEQHGTWETLAKFDEVKPCPVCETPGVRLVSMPAKMATLWNAGWNSGLGGNGFFSYSAGQRVSSQREEERIMNARGKINIKDLGGDAFEDSFIAGKQRERDDHEKLVTTYQNNLKAAGGDKLRAVTETFPAHEMLKQAHAHDAAKESA